MAQVEFVWRTISRIDRLKTPTGLCLRSLLPSFERRFLRVASSLSYKRLRFCSFEDYPDKAALGYLETSFPAYKEEPMSDFEEAGLVMSILALLGLALMAEGPIETACERVLNWLRVRRSHSR